MHAYTVPRLQASKLKPLAMPSERQQLQCLFKGSKEALEGKVTAARLPMFTMRVNMPLHG